MLSEVFKRSIESGLRIIGNEQTADGERHRRRYRWAAGVAKRHEAKRILDFGCGSGYGSRILSSMLKEAQVVGYDPDHSAIEFAREASGLKPLRREDPPRPLHFLTGKAVASLSAFNFDLIVFHSVAEHIREKRPREQLLDLLKLAPRVVGFFPYKEPAGCNHEHFWNDLDESELEGLKTEKRLYEPLWGNFANHVVPNTINLLFVITR